MTHYYYIPLNKVEGWDGNVLWLTVPEEHVKSSYERNAYPEHSRHIVKDDFPYKKIPPDFPEPIRIPYKSKRLVRAKTTTGTASTSSILPPSSYKCDLCNISVKSESQLSNYLSTKHR